MEDLKQSLGNALRTAREAAKISVDDAVYLGKIPRDVLIALESEDFGFFNSPLYARSFLKQYGEYVGVDVEEWLDDIEATAMIDGDDLESLIDLSAPTTAPKLRERHEKRKTRSGMPAIWLIVLTGGLLFGAFKAYQILEKNLSTPETTAQTSGSKPSAETPTPVDENPPTDPTGEAVPESDPTPNEPEAPQRAIVVELPEN